MDDIQNEQSRPKGMIYVEGGTFMMGSERFYPEEAPQLRVELDSYLIDETPVTNLDFSRFVSATAYVTVAEIPPDPIAYPGMSAEMAKPGSLVFHKAEGPVDLYQPSHWWHFVFGANWRHPYGPDTDITTLNLWDHPVVHIAYADAEAYAHWAGKRLPTEAQFEYAARNVLAGSDFSWGNELTPNGKMMANYWQGIFPFFNSLQDGWERTSPVKAFPANNLGIYDMIGNTWEWTQDWWTDRACRPKKNDQKDVCCTISNPKGGRLKDSFDPAFPDILIGRKVLKGGSHLCAENYCQRYRPAARHPEMIDTATSHIGFRCVKIADN